MRRARSWFLAAVLAALVGCGGTSNSGDRVLVSKAHYETRFKEPNRFDVVVFKYPRDPIEKNTPKNYIKRLLGLPGEIIAIFFGQLYRFANPDGSPPYQDHLDPEISPLKLWHKTRDHDDPKGTQMFEEGRFEIIRKTPDIMMALRRIVYDNDFQAKSMTEFPRWASSKESSWSADKQRGFNHAGAKADQCDWLRYRHLIRPSNGVLPVDLQPSLITDFMGYNFFVIRDRNGNESPQGPAENWVGDLMLECQVEASKGEGEFGIELSKGIQRFQAMWDLGSGMCTLYKLDYREVEENGSRTLKLMERVELDKKPSKLRGPGTFQVRVANFDARLTVWVDKEMPFGDGKDYPPPEVRNGASEKDLDDGALHARRGPTRNDLEPASVGAKGAAVHIQHIRLWRDTYYSLSANSHHSDVGPVDLSEPTKWDEFRRMRYKTMYVQPGHYLCLGDNSQASSDSRDWGLVPERLMLGRALMVYFPFHRAGPIR